MDVLGLADTRMKQVVVGNHSTAILLDLSKFPVVLLRNRQ
jgi:hypothetical protein